MALRNSFGSLARHIAASKWATTNTMAPGMQLLNSIRHMSSAKLFVGGLSYSTDDQSLRDAFGSFGNITEARVIIDRDSGRSRGFGFVSFESDQDAASAMSGMDGQELQGRNIRVNYADDKPAGGGGFRGGNGGFRGGNGGGRFGGGDDFGGSF